MHHTEDLLGKMIVSSDGDELGTIKAAQGQYVHVDAHMRPDYWLDITDAKLSESGLMIPIMGKELDAFKLSAPGDEMADVTSGNRDAADKRDATDHDEAGLVLPEEIITDEVGVDAGLDAAQARMRGGA